MTTWDIVASCSTGRAMPACLAILFSSSMRTASDARNPIVLPKGPENIGFHRRGGCRKAADGNVHSTLSSLFYMQAGGEWDKIAGHDASPWKICRAARP